MAGPYDLLFGPNADPLRAIAMAGVRPAREPSPLPDVPREEQDRLLGTLGETSLGGLAYLGKTLDKPGRAVRGLLAGNPREALNVLPFSDALGLTDERDTVSGTDLNARWGLTTPGDDSWANLGAGFATEVLLDPLTYVGVGPLTKAGKVLQKAGQLPRGFAPKVAGEGFVRESVVAPTLAAGQQAIDSPLLKGGKTLVTSGTEAKAAAQGVDIAEGTPLASLFGIGLPFMEPAVQFGTGRFAQKTAGVLDAIGGGIAASAPVRAIRAAIDPTAGGVTNRDVQRIVGETVRPASDAAKASYREGVYDLLREANPLIEKDQRTTADVIRMAAEFDPAAPVLAGSRSLRDQAHARAVAAGYSPAEADLAVDIGERLGKHVRAAGPGESARGVNRADLEDAAVDYFTRSKNDIPRQPGESWPSYVRRLTDEFSARHGSTIERLPFLKGVPGGTVQVNDWAKDPALKAMTGLQREAYFRQALTGSQTPVGNKAAYAQAAQLSKWVESLPDVYAKDGIDFFRPDPFADAVLRGDRAGKAVGTAEGVYRAVRDFGEAVPALAARGVADTVPASAVLEATGLGGAKLTAPPGGGVMTNRADDIVRQRLGLGPADDLADIRLPGDIARDLIRVHTAWTTPQQLGPVAAAWDMVSNLFKSWLTTPFPAFHTRNVVTGLFNQWRDGALSPSALKEAYAVMRGGELKAGAAATNELIREAVSRGVAFTPDAGRSGDVAAQAAGLIDPGRFPKASGNTLVGDAVRAVGEQAGRVREAPIKNLLNPANITGVAGTTDANAVIALGRKAQAFGDDLVRLSHYLAKRQQGFSPDAAALAVKKYHMDWQDLTGTERNVLRRVIPFYSYSRKNLPPVLEDLVKRPAKTAFALRGVAGVREPFEFVPGYVAEGASIPVPGAPDGQQRYVSSFGLPIEDELLKAVGSVGSGDISRGLQQVLGMTQPLIKAPVELAFGTQLFSGRPLEELRQLESVKSTGLLNEESGRLVSQALANSPASRFFTTLDKFIDERKGLGPTALNTLTGARITDVDADRQRDLAAKRLLQDTLRGKSGVRVSEDVYVPRENLPLLDPLEMQLYAVYKAASNRVRQQAKERAAQQSAGGR